MTDLKPCPNCGALPCDRATIATHTAEPAPVAVEGAPYEFDRYVGGMLMAEGVRIDRQGNLPDAMRAASTLASKGPKGEVPVLVYRPRADLAPTGNTALVEAVARVEACFDQGAFTPKSADIRLILAALQPAAPQPTPEVDAWRDVLAERRRQVSAEGWTIEHDDEHVLGELGLAGALYALPYEAEVAGEKLLDQESYIGLDITLSITCGWNLKPEPDRRKRLVKATALMLAEIERLDRTALARGSVAEKAEGEDRG